MRRIEAVTGLGSLAMAREALDDLDEVAGALKSPVDDVLKALERLAERHRRLERELRSLQQARIADEASQLAATVSQPYGSELGALAGIVIARRDRLDTDALREIAVAVRGTAGCRGAVIGGTPDGGRVALVAALAPGEGLDASKVISVAARVVGGGGGGTADLAVAGGKDPGRIDEALEVARQEIMKISGESGGDRPS